MIVSSSKNLLPVVRMAPVAAVAGLLLVSLMSLGGCATEGFAPAPTPGGYAGSSFTGVVKAGNSPIAGAMVQLYAAGTTGNGSADTALLGASLTTSSSGVFRVPAGYSCPAAGSLVYLVATGGAASASAANGDITLMAAVGPCNSVSTGASFVIDEATSVAAVYVLAPFYATTAAIGASSTNYTGLLNAFQTATSLVNPATGVALNSTSPVNLAAAAARIDSLANLMNTCVAAASGCPGFYSALGVAPSNTLDALYALVKNPAAHTAAIYKAAAANSTYQPALTAAPSDFTLFVTVTGGGMNEPSALAVDGGGNVWVASYNGVASEFNTLGLSLFSNTGITGDGLNESFGIAVDLQNNAWIANEQPYSAAGTGSVSELSSAGVSLAGPNGYTAGGMNYPIAVAIDPNGAVWVVQYGNSYVTLLNSAGKPTSGASGFTSPSFVFPVAVAIDGNHFGWIGDQNDETVTKVAPDGSSFTPYRCCDGANSLAIDQANNVWIGNFYGDSVSMISSGGQIVSNGAYTGLGSLDHPKSVAIDGSGNVWVANYRAPYLTELAGSSAASPGASLSPSSGLGADAALLEAFSLAIDASGSIWVSNPPSNTVTKFIGLATPVKTPLSGLPKAP